MSDKIQNTIGMRLEGKSTYLRPSTHTEVTLSYSWFLSDNAQSNNPFALPFATAESLADKLCSESNHAESSALAIVNIKSDEMIGLVRFFNWNNHNRSVEVEILINFENRKKGFGREAVFVLCKYLFETRGLNKIIMQTTEANIPLVALLEKTGFKKDGVLRRHYFSEGEYHDGLLFTLLRFEAPV